MPPDEIIFQTLARHGVPFVIVGGHAVILHGYGRTTEDADVVWLRSPESEIALAAALREIDACYIGNDIDPATRLEALHPVSLLFIQAHPLMMLWTRHGFLDLFDYIPGHPSADVQRVFEGSIEFNGMRYASLEMLRMMKRAAGRTKDMLDLEKLAEIHSDGLDRKPNG